jgi:hypothetical protein
MLVFSTGKKKTRLLFYRYNNQGRTRKRKRGIVRLQMSAAKLFSGYGGDGTPCLKTSVERVQTEKRLPRYWKRG